MAGSRPTGGGPAGAARPRRRLLALAALCLAFFGMPASPAQTAPRPLPPLLRSLSDEAGVLDVAQGRALAARIADLEQQADARIIVLIAKTIRPESIAAYAQRLIARWRKRTNALEGGRFVFVVIVQEDREFSVVPGEALTYILKRLMARDAMADVQMRLGRDEYYEAIALILDKLAQLIRPSSDVVRSSGPPGTQARCAFSPRQGAGHEHEAVRGQRCDGRGAGAVRSG
ncbi:hypothetical protein SVA_3141 [Sulfurifustis variabilis]|uniref:TPM domain-containing protein n=1 Tax=Sulfurifustis variabilis TaxID=1675686 RepID=A0A1B4V834_9GAMM|nr:TPM domain-containing protein [Sulfurifustis variabilis]BAU49689.1 hypothetical protein SVA_3141 [Sulfurifustis variabilis]